MNHLLVILFLIIGAFSIIFGCGKEDKRNVNCVNKGEQCHGEDDTNKEQTTVQSSSGQSEAKGPKGEKGDNCTVTRTSEEITFSCGKDVVIIPVPKNGAQGADGTNGVNGMGCSVTPAVNGALITCATGSVLVLNGTDGQDGANGEDGEDGSSAEPTPYTVTEIIDPCGKQSNWDEVLLKLANGDIIASFSENANGKNTRFVRLVPGTYQTTDSTSCTFTVHSNNTITWQ